MSNHHGFPWLINSPETMIVTDTIMNDGRFILYTLVHEVLHLYANDNSNHNCNNKNIRTTTSSSSSNNKHHYDNDNAIVLWINGTSRSEEQIRMGLQQLNGGNNNANSTTMMNHRKFIDPTIIASNITIQSIPILMSQSISSHNNNNNWDIEHFVKYEMYQFIRRWILSFQQESSLSSATTTTTNGIILPWIIIEDISCISNLIGKRLTYALIHSIQCLKHIIPFGLIIRYSSDYEYDNIITKSFYHNYDWIGAGHHPKQQNNIKNNDNKSMTSSSSWEHSFIEFATLIIDVVPLLTGYSREVHGRLLFTRISNVNHSNNDDDETNQDESKSSKATMSRNSNTPIHKNMPTTSMSNKNITPETTTMTSIFNYCLHDDHVVTYRIK